MNARTLRWEHAAIAAVALLATGAVAGSLAASAPTVKAPHQCTVMANLAEGIFVDQENATTVTHLMTTRGQTEYAGHEADLHRIWDDVDEAYGLFVDAKAACLGGAK